MDTAFMRKSFALIAKGLVEKEELLSKEPTRYPYSKTLQHGMNMFLAACYHMGKVENAFQYANEAAFLEQFITKPICEWFSDWDPIAIEDMKLQEEPFYAYDAFAYRRNDHMYVPSADCFEFLDTQDSDIMDGTDEHVLYEKMIVLDQDAYCKVRKYIIENPIISIDARREMSIELADNPAAKEAFQFAYEEITEDFYYCPCCGWTMTEGKYGYTCHSTHCVDILPEFDCSAKVSCAGCNLFRLKKGIMRYFAAPGKLELEIAAFCDKKKIQWALWPQMDRYDVEIRFSDGTLWEVDAKVYRNPIALRTKIKNDNGFPEGDYAKGFFVIPDEYVRNQRNYTSIINQALKDQKNVKCVTLRALKIEMNRKEEVLHEEK